MLTVNWYRDCHVGIHFQEILYHYMPINTGTVFKCIVFSFNCIGLKLCGAINKTMELCRVGILFYIESKSVITVKKEKSICSLFINLLFKSPAIVISFDLQIICMLVNIFPSVVIWLDVWKLSVSKYD